MLQLYIYLQKLQHNTGNANNADLKQYMAKKHLGRVRTTKALQMLECKIHLLI